MSFDPVEEHQAGLLCEQGFMKERYSEKLDDLVRVFTPKGIDVVKEILKDPNYQETFKQMLYDELKDFPREEQAGILNEIHGMLNGNC